MARELWDLYDANGMLTGRTMQRGEPVPRGLYHLGVHIWPINARGEFLIQQRSPDVQWKPNMWACTGGCAVAGEDSLAAARRELREEIGYDAREDELHVVAHLRRSNAFCGVYALHTDRAAAEFSLQKEEVSAVKWCSMRELERMAAHHQLYHYGDAYFRMLAQYQKDHGAAWA